MLRLVVPCLALTLVAPPEAMPEDRPPVQRPRVQRPKGLEKPANTPGQPVPSVPAEPEPTPAPPPAPSPAIPAQPSTPVETTTPAEPVELEPPAGPPSLQIRVLDSVEEMPVEGALILIQGGGLEERVELTTDIGGYADAALPPGRYTVRLIAGKIDLTRVVTLEAGPTPLDFQVDRGRYSRDMDEYKRADARPEFRRATLVASAGGVLIAGGIFTGVAAGLEAQRPDCPLGQSECNFGPRTDIATGLGVAAAISIAGGTALVVLGVRNMRRARPTAYMTPRSAGVGMAMAF